MEKRSFISWVVSISIIIVFIIGILMVNEGSYITGSIMIALDILFFGWFTLFESR